MIDLKTIDYIDVFLWCNMSSFLSILTVDPTEFKQFEVVVFFTAYSSIVFLRGFLWCFAFVSEHDKNKESKMFNWLQVFQ